MAATVASATIFDAVNSEVFQTNHMLVHVILRKAHA